MTPSDLDYAEGLRQQIAEAFLLGFMVSREGFNGDCGYEHCAPSEVAPYHTEEAEFRQWAYQSPAFTALRAKALKRLADATPESAASELAKLREQLENQASIIRDSCTPANEREVRMLRELASLREDKETVDWLQKDPMVNLSKALTLAWQKNFEFRFALRAARKETP